MKFLSLILFIVALVWTWGIIHSVPKVSFETHVGIHDNLAVYIQEALAAKRPEAKDFQIHRLWTEETKADNGELKAHFTYSFSEEADKTRSTIQGWAILEAIKEADGQPIEPGTKWRVKEVQPTSDSVTFEEGTTVKAKEDLPPETPTTPATEAAPPVTPAPTPEPTH